MKARIDLILIVSAIAVLALVQSHSAFAERDGGSPLAITPIQQKPAADVRASTIAGIDELTAETERLKGINALIFKVKIEDGIFKLLLRNEGETSCYYFDSIKLGTGGIPRETWIQVLTDDGTLFKGWPISLDDEDGYWSPNLMSNSFEDVAVRLPAKLAVLEPGESRTLQLPIEKFFYRVSPEVSTKAKNGMIRVHSRLYLDPKLDYWLEARTDWVPLSVEISLCR